jgi:parallel beta-helix repeat protein
VNPAVHVHQGESIQAAVDAAAPGTTIFIDAGLYPQTVKIAKADIHLVGLHGAGGTGVVIENPGGQNTGIEITEAGSGVVLRNLTVDGFVQNDVELRGVTGFLVTHVNATGSSSYGIFPLFCANGSITHCSASGHNDTGIYVGQSERIQISDNLATANVIGIEIENSHHVQAIDNASYNNTAGILVDLLPRLQINTCADNLLQGNKVHDNNLANFGNPGDIASFVPSGSGILIIGADRTTVQDNRVTRNSFFGIALVSVQFLVQIGALPPGSLKDIEPNPDGTLIENNNVVRNGQSSSIQGIPPADLLWDGTGTGNQWIGNHYHTSYPKHLPG